MKRLLIMLGAFFCVVASVNAYENTLRFIESDNSIYYDSEKYDDNLFMNHLDMIPGEENEDVLHIENTTDKEFNLYFRVVDKEYTEEEAELIANTTMTIFIDDDIIYDGSIDGENHEDGINLTNAIKIGEYSSGSESDLRVVTKLSEDYTNAQNEAVVEIDWEFYAEYDDAILPINPITLDRIHHNVIIFIVSTVALIVIGIMFFRIRKTRN